MFSKIILFIIHISCPTVKFLLIFLFSSLKTIYQSLSIQPSRHLSFIYFIYTGYYQKWKKQEQLVCSCLQWGLGAGRGWCLVFPALVSLRLPRGELPLSFLCQSLIWILLETERPIEGTPPTPATHRIASTSWTAYQKLVHTPFKQANLSVTVILQWPMWDWCPAGGLVFWKLRLCDWR